MARKESPALQTSLHRSLSRLNGKTQAATFGFMAERIIYIIPITTYGNIIRTATYGPGWQARKLSMTSEISAYGVLLHPPIARLQRPLGRYPGWISKIIFGCSAEK